MKIHRDIAQGSDAWLKLRAGKLTASCIKKILTSKTKKAADNESSRLFMYELLAQKLTGYIEPSFVSDDMMRGHDDEEDARQVYEEHCAPVDVVGFVEDDRWGFTLGYSPDGLVGDDGLIEIKAPRAKYQLAAIVNDEVDAEYTLQLQAGLLVTQRAWIDVITYSAGLPMMIKRVLPDPELHEAIVEAARSFYTKMDNAQAIFEARCKADPLRLIPTERKEHTITGSEQ